MTAVGYQVAALISLFILGLASLFLGEEAYRRERLFWFDPATSLGQRTQLSGRTARLIGLLLMVVGAFFLFTAIAAFFLLPFLLDGGSAPITR